MSQNRFDDLLNQPTSAAIVMRQPMMPVEGEGGVIYPPTFAGSKESEKSGYNIDTLNTGESGKPRNVCLIDSVGSQANRIEPLFKRTPYCDLVPQIQIRVKTKEVEELVHLFDAGHRIADAVARCSELLGEIQEAFLAVKSGNCEPLARLAPTSLVFGVWDSRGTQVKLPRIVRSTIRALNVQPLTRSAQYIPAINYSESGVLNEEEAKKGAEQGFNHVPSTHNPGGVLLVDDSQVLREAVLSLSALRALRAESDEMTAKLQRYILGLSLVALTAPQEPLLRMGCELTGDPEKPATWEQVACTGQREAFNLSHGDALAFAQAAATDFGVAEGRVVDFNAKKAKDSLKKKEKK